MLGRLIQYVRGATSISWSSVGIQVSLRKVWGKGSGAGSPSSGFSDVLNLGDNYVSENRYN